jgi:hypothetical protein
MINISYLGSNMKGLMMVVSYVVAKEHKIAVKFLKYTQL